MSLRRWSPTHTSWLWLTCFFLVSVAHFASFDLRRQPIGTDIRFYLYYAARTADGDVPYVDFFEHKTPLAIYAGALLHKTGEVLGVDSLYVIRAGYLLLASITATVMGAILVRLFNNRPMAGWFGVLAYCGFGLLGVMPAAGNIPKQIGMLCAGLAILAVYRQKWFWAGIWAGIAGLDWQPCGALAGMGVIVAACVQNGRARRLILSTIGMIVPFVPLLVYFASIGALRVLLDSIIFTSLTKASADPVPFAERVKSIVLLLREYTADSEWLVLAAVAGTLICTVSLFRFRSHATRPVLLAFAVYHYGIIAFTLTDFQGLGDLFVLVGTLAPFAAVCCAGLFFCSLKRLRKARRKIPALAPRVFVLATFALLVLFVRPSFLREGWRVNQPPIGPFGSELQAQRNLADRLFQVVEDRSILLVRQQELLYLDGRVNCAPFVTWNQGTYSHWREGDESLIDTFVRMARPFDPDAVIVSPQWFPELARSALGDWLLPNYRCLQISSDDETYQTLVWYRRGLPIPTVPNVRFLNPAVFGRMSQTDAPK